MTQSRIYTAVLINWQGHETQIVEVTGPMDTNEMRTKVEAEYPGTCMVALVPGCHAGHSIGYSLRYSGFTVKPGAQTDMQQLDLFDTGWISKKNKQ